MPGDYVCAYCDEPAAEFQIKQGANIRFWKNGPAYQGAYTEALCTNHAQGRKDQAEMMSEDLREKPKAGDGRGK